MMNFISLYIGAMFLIGCSGGSNVESLRQELMDVDRAFSRLSSEVGMNKAFKTYCAEEGVLLRAGSMPVTGIQAITERLAKTDDSVFELTWEPMHASLAKSADQGYTYGVYQMKLKGSDEVEKGTYVSIWIKENGSWKFVLDTGNEGIGE